MNPQITTAKFTSEVRIWWYSNIVLPLEKACLQPSLLQLVQEQPKYVITIGGVQSTRHIIS